MKRLKLVVASALMFTPLVSNGGPQTTVCNQFSQAAPSPLCPVFCDALANHATFEVSTNKLSLSNVDIPALDHITSKPNGYILNVDAKLNLTGASDFGLDMSSVRTKGIVGAYNQCHPQYIYKDGIGSLFIPFIDMPVSFVVAGMTIPGPTQVFAAKLTQLPNKPATIFTLQDSYYQLLGVLP